MNLHKLLEQLASGKSEEPLLDIIFDTKKPVGIRAKILLDVILSGSQEMPALHGMLTRLLDKMSQVGEAEEALKLKQLYQSRLAEMEDGPARPATVIRVADDTPGTGQRVHVICPDGTERFPYLRDGLKAIDLKVGQTVYLDGKGLCILQVSKMLPYVGQTGTFKRRVPGTNSFQVNYRDEVLTLYGAQAILDEEAAGTIKPGDPVLFCPRRQFVFAKLPPEEANRHRFIDSSKVPDIVAARDIGNPNPILGWMIRRLRVMLYNPELGAAFDMRSRSAVALVGPSGTGKTLTIKAFIHQLVEELRKFAGRDVGSRVIRATTANLLSEYFGVSDRKIDAFFSEIETLAAEEFVVASGEKVRLPLVVILEEAEGLTHRRGGADGGVYDRIIGILLQRLDDPIDDLSKLPIFFITTTNRGDMVDVAAWRRLAGVTARFHRLDCQGTSAVLAKKLKPHFRYAAEDGVPAESLRNRLIDRVVATLYSPNGSDQPLVEITLRDGKRVLRYFRDFLTGAICEQAISNAIDEIVFSIDESGDTRLGLSATAVIDVLKSVIEGLADNLTAHNVADYVDLPDGSATASVRRLRPSNGKLAHLVY